MERTSGRDEFGTTIDGAMHQVSEGVVATTDGWFVLAGGAAVIDDQDQLISGEATDSGIGGVWIATELGEFQLLPRGLLLTPYGEVIDLHAVRAELAGQTPQTTLTVPTSSPVLGSIGG